MSKPKRKALIVTPDDAEWRDVVETELKRPSDFQFEGAKRYIFPGIDALDSFNKYLFDCLLFFDDCRSYLRATTDPRLKNIFIRRRQKMLDVLLVGHGFTDIPPQAFTNASDIFLFKTKDNIKKRKDVLIDFDLMVEAQARINKKAETDKHYYERIIF